MTFAICRHSPGSGGEQKKTPYTSNLPKTTYIMHLEQTRQDNPQIYYRVWKHLVEPKEKEVKEKKNIDGKENIRSGCISSAP